MLRLRKLVINRRRKEDLLSIFLDISHLVSLDFRISAHPGHDGSKNERSRCLQVAHRGASRGGCDTGCGRGLTV